MRNVPIRFVSVSAGVLAAIVVSATPARAADGDLDPTFGTGGKVITGFAVPSATAQAAALQPDGKIVAVGFLFDVDANVDFAVARYNTDGSLDGAFGSGGRVRTDFFGYFDNAYTVAVLPDGKILVAGTATTPPQALIFALARYNADGTLDKTFGDGGKATGGSFGIVKSLVLLPDNRIVAAGNGWGPLSNDFTLVRFTANGSVDATFGDGGVTRADFAGETDSVAAALQVSGGKLLVVGSASNNVTVSDVALARYTADGLPDASFGVGGKLSFDLFGRANDVFAATLQPDGKILLAGGAGAFSVIRLRPDGDLDPAFGSGGVASGSLGSSDQGAWAIALQPDGRIILAGLANGPTLYDFALVRFDSGGALDSTFGNGGVRTDFAGSESAYAVLVQPDGRVVAVGGTRTETVGSFALARYLSSLPDTTAPPCPRSFAFWRHHPELWPVTSLVLGSRTYAASELQDLLGRPAKGDASLILARELIAAKLNLAAGVVPGDLASLVATGDSLLSPYSGALPYGVSPASSSGQEMIHLAGRFTSRNKGSGGDCGPAQGKIAPVR